MTLSIIVRGQKLTQEQLDAIVPVLNARMNKRMSSKKFEEACIKAMAEAGCPLVDNGEGKRPPRRSGGGQPKAVFRRSA